MDGLEKHFSLEEILLKFNLEFQKRILVMGGVGEGVGKGDEQNHIWIRIQWIKVDWGVLVYMW